MRNLDDPKPTDSAKPLKSLPFANLNPFVLIGALTVGCIAFGVVYYVTTNRATQAQALAQEPPPADAPEAPKIEEPAAVVEAPKPKAPVPPPPKPDPLIFREIVAPEPAQKDPKDILGDNHHWRTLALNYDGSRLLTTSDTKIIRWDTATGIPVQIFDRGNSWKEAYFTAPDSRTLIQFHYDSKSVSVYNTETRALLGRYEVQGVLSHYGSGHMPAFAPDGEEMAFLEEIRIDIGNTMQALHVVNLRTGQGRAFAKGFTENKQPFKRHFLHLYPIPGSRELLGIVRTLGTSTDNPNNAYAVNIDTGSVRPLKWLSNPSMWVKYPGQHITASSDGTQLLFNSPEHGPALATWPKGDVVSVPKVGSYRWTPDRLWMPDGHRLLRINAWDGNYIKIGFGSLPGYQIDYLELVDLTRGKVVSSISYKDFPTSNNESLSKLLAVSGDGKTIALGGKTRIGLVRFNRLYSTPPLPPAKQAKGYLN